MSGRIQNGARVLWTAPGGGLRDYAGLVCAYIPAGQRVGEAARPQMQGLDYVTMLCKVPPLRQKPSSKARYLVRCPEDATPKTVQYRTVWAALLDKQNLSAPREGT